MSYEEDREYYIDNCLRTVRIIGNVHVLDPYLEKYPKSQFMKWNEEYVEENLNTLFSYLETLDDSYSSLKMHCRLFLDITSVYHENYTIYERILDYLKKLGIKYGYFYNFALKNCYPNIPPLSISIGNVFFYNFLRPHDERPFFFPRKLQFYYHDRKDEGIIDILLYLGHKDLAYRYINEYLYEVVYHFHEDNKIMKDNDITYLFSKKYKIGLPTITEIVLCLRKFNCEIPDWIKNVIEEYPETKVYIGDKKIRVDNGVFECPRCGKTKKLFDGIVKCLDCGYYTASVSDLDIVSGEELIDRRYYSLDVKI